MFSKDTKLVFIEMEVVVGVAHNLGVDCLSSQWAYTDKKVNGPIDKINTVSLSLSLSRETNYSQPQ